MRQWAPAPLTRLVANATIAWNPNLRRSVMPIHLPPLTRRRFLKGTLAAGAALLVPVRLGAAEPGVDPNRVALLSDTHIPTDPAKPYGQVNRVENLAKALSQVIALDPRPANVIVSGDCALKEGLPAAYAVLKQLLEPVRKAGIAIHLCLGNHDHRANFCAAFPDAKPSGSPLVADKHVAIVETPRADFLLLDSLEKVNKTPGLLGMAQLKWLGRTLDARKGKPALTVAHHDPNFGKRKSGLTDTEALFALLKARRRAAAYVYGHSHRWEYKKSDNLHLVNVPTTAHLFKKDEPRGWVDARLTAHGATLVLHALDSKHKAHGETVKLTWRA